MLNSKKSPTRPPQLSQSQANPFSQPSYQSQQTLNAQKPLMSQGVMNSDLLGSKGSSKLIMTQKGTTSS